MCTICDIEQRRRTSDLKPLLKFEDVMCRIADILMPLLQVIAVGAIFTLAILMFLGV